MALKVFICYRRDESAADAGRIYDRRERDFGRDLLFMDVDAIPLGANFVKVIGEEVARGVRFQPSQPRSTRAESHHGGDRSVPEMPSAAGDRQVLHLLCGRHRAVALPKLRQGERGLCLPLRDVPALRGSLRVLERAGVSDEASLNAIRTAFQIELGGKAFYERAADQVADPVLKELFTKFSAMEHEHMETLSRRYHVQPPDPAEGFRVDIAAIQAGVEGDIADPETLFARPSRSRNAPSISSASAPTPCRRARRSRTCTRSSPPRRSSMSPCWRPSCTVGPRAGPGCSRASRER